MSISADCTFKDLCLDVRDAPRMARFWSAVLGLTEPQGRTYRLADATDEHALWLNAVPEPKSAKHRVHLDVHTASVDDLRDLGASVLDDTHPWTVMADPEGGEFCAFVRPADQLPRYRLYELVVDAQDPKGIASWWADRFGAAAGAEPGDDSRWIEGAGELPWPMIFVPVPEPKTVKNRLHWDVWGETDDLLTAGATLLRRRGSDIDWDVLADPEGNEFCVFTPSAP